MATTDYLPLLNKGLRENYNLAARDYVLMAKKIFHVASSKSRYEMEQTWGGYPLPQARFDGAPIASGGLFPSFNKTYTHVNYGMSDVLPNEAMDDDQYGMLFGWVAGRGGMMARSFVDLQEIVSANWLAAQFTNSLSVAGSADGTGLFSNAHAASPGSANVQSNVASSNLDLTNSAMDIARYSLQLQKAPNNITIRRNSLKTLVVSPKLEKVAIQIQKGDWVNGTANRDKNTLQNSFEIMSWPYWTASGAASSTAFNSWFVQGDEHFLKWFDREGVTFDSQKLLSVNSIYFAAMMRFSFGATSWYGMYGSPGN